MDPGRAGVDRPHHEVPSTPHWERRSSLEDDVTDSLDDGITDDSWNHAAFFWVGLFGIVATERCWAMRPSEADAARVNVPARTGSGVISEDSLDASIRAIQINSALAAQPDAVAVPLIILEVAVEHEVA
jgi:hypothetical protein